ncbi:DUF2125 domain-containing protein [Roseinatronobacter alkalisoli]|uniref:DUF2125 domain-containing protein n=1 Tax=Roseinatronobacter alkalisoli TaxID=3028235 RepID=A0ABT5T8J5_9RHOB|nr:DUF2125 domain-containing protein [Roseinatronobacter sp. HJB301]MDD7970487.1 DUF2125 domain-containing protein [Roseinatronobacter sp. HJB301]
MRVILATIMLAAIGYGAYWHYAARELDSRISATLAHNDTLTASDYSLGGFPHRFDLTLHAPRLRLADGEIDWQGEALNLHALSYKPHHVIAVFPPVQILGLYGQDWHLRSADARASVVARSGVSGAVDRANLVFATPQFSHRTITHEADSLRASLTHFTGAQYELALDLSGLRPDAGLLAGLDPDRMLPPMLARSRVLAMLDFASPLHLNAGLPPLREIDIDELEIIWGDITLQASGVLRPDVGGTLSGQLDMRMTQWETVVSLLVSTGVIPPDGAQMARMIFASLSDQSTGQLALPLQVRQSVLSLGPVVLGQLPRF